MFHQHFARQLPPPKTTRAARDPIRTRIASRSRQDGGQTLTLFAALLLVIFGFVAMSVDVGRLVWARTEMQSSVDASVLAAAQSMPNTALAAVEAQSYWKTNNALVGENGTNSALTVAFPAGGNRSVHVRGDADVPTIFARLFGIDSWHVSAEAQAESQVVDALLVLDRSGSMCWDSHGKGNSCQEGPPKPLQPWTNVRSGGEIFVSQFASGFDHIGFVHFSTWAEMQTSLNGDLAATSTAVSNAPDPTTLGNGDGRTNIAHGFYLANQELISRGRANSNWVVVLLSDGVANTKCTPTNSTSCASRSTNQSAARDAALAQADFATANGITVYTIGYGNASDDALMQEIADRTGGAFFKTPNAVQLEKAFAKIAQLTKLRLTS